MGTPRECYEEACAWYLKDECAMWWIAWELRTGGLSTLGDVLEKAL